MTSRTRQETLSAKYARTAGKTKETRVDKARIDELLELSLSPDGTVRRDAAGELCPCHVQHNDERIWDRLIAMLADPDPRVRSVVLHTLTDGSPREREADVVSALEARRDDPDPKLRRRIRNLLAGYRRHGNVNLG